MKRHRLANDDKAFVRGQLAQGLRSLGMDEATIEATLNTGSVPLPVDVTRRIARMDEYADGGCTIDLVRRAFGDWIAYKAGVRQEE